MFLTIALEWMDSIYETIENRETSICFTRTVPSV